jgi:non-ribosomal peptide synthetase component F
VNTLAMREQVDIEEDVVELIKRVGKSVQAAQLNQDIPFDVLVNELGIEKNPGRHPLFQVEFSLLTSEKRQREEWEKLLTDYSNVLGNEPAKFDLSLNMTDEGDVINGNFNYAVSLFDRGTIQSYVDAYKEIINQIAALGDDDETEH